MVKLYYGSYKTRISADKRAKELRALRFSNKFKVKKVRGEKKNQKVEVIKRKSALGNYEIFVTPKKFNLY